MRRAQLQHTVVEVHAALLLAKEGAAVISQDKSNPDADLKKVVGSILFGEESAEDNKPAALTSAQKLKQSLGAKFKSFGTFGAATFKNKALSAAEKEEPKRRRWDKEQTRQMRIKEKREERLKRVRSLISLCDDAASGATTDADKEKVRVCEERGAKADRCCVNNSCFATSEASLHGRPINPQPFLARRSCLSRRRRR